MSDTDSIDATFHYAPPGPVQMVLERFGDRIREVEIETRDGDLRSIWRFRIGDDAEKGAA